MADHLLFVCVANRVRSPFAEFFIRDIWNESGEDIIMSSAGYFPQTLKDRLAKHNISSPDPFFNRPMAQLTRAALLEKGIHVPNGWRSKELSPEIMKQGDLIITALNSQKEALCSEYVEFNKKIFTISELSNQKNYPFLEDIAEIPHDDNFWHHCEEDVQYVSKTLKIWEQILMGALPSLTQILTGKPKSAY